MATSSEQVYSNVAGSRSGSPNGRGRAKSQTIRLIRDISPAAALQAFYTGTLALGDDEDPYYRLDLTSCTFAEKDLGIRVAQAGKQLKAWCSEIEQWGWSGSFEAQPEGRQTHTGAERAGKSAKDLEDEVADLVAEDSDYARPVSNKRDREQRLEDISEELDKLDYDELKSHVLGLHHGRSRPGSGYSDISMHNLMMMDDYTILVTHTLMQSLPHLLLLRQYLDTWTVRLHVLGTCPAFLADLAQAQRGMTLAWQILTLPNDADEYGLSAPAFSKSVLTIRKVLQKKVYQLGVALDKMLDELEGREDKLPEQWIDGFEILESEYSNWTVKAQHDVLDLEMQEGRRRLAEFQGQTSSSRPTSSSTTRTSRSPVALRIETSAPVGITSKVDDFQQDDYFDEEQPSTEGRRASEERVANTAIREQVATVILSRRASLTSVRSFSSNEIKRISVIRSPTGSGHATPHRPRSIVDEPRTPISPISTAGRYSDDVVRATLSRSNSILSVTHTPLPVTLEEPLPMNDTFALPSVPRETAQSVTMDEERFPISSGPEIIEEETRVMRAASDHTIVQGPSAASTSSRPSTPGQVERPPEPKTPASAVSAVSDPDGLHSPQESPSKRAGWKPQQGVLNAVMAKRRNTFKENLGTKKAPHRSAPPVPVKSPRRPRPITQDMESQISSILTTLPTPIKLESRRKASGTITPVPRTRLTNVTQPLRRSRAPSLTLARAATPLPPMDNDKVVSAVPRSRKSLGSEEAEIQLYHLSSSKGLAPTKLYIRRVGENGERLMVRVGGGWADLADYLQQYAEHHGRRAVSGTHDSVQVLGMESASNTSSPASAHPSSGDAPGSANTSRRSSAGAHVMLGSDTPAAAATPLSPLTSLADAHDTSDRTPQSTASNSSRRSLGPGDHSASLAGPRIKKLDLSGEKQEWIDGMVEKAKKANTIELDKDRRGDGFTDIGKVGGTRRVYMKGQ